MNHFLFITFALRFLGVGSKTESNARLSLLGATFGIGVSIIPLVVVLVISDGMVEGIGMRTIELGTGQAQIIDIQPSQYFSNCENELVLKDKLKADIKDPYFINAWVQREGHGLLVGKMARSGGIIRAVEPAFFTENPKGHDLINVINGKPSLKEENAIILGQKIAEKLNLNVGDACRLITLRENSNGKRIPKISVFIVEAIISSGYQELDSLWIFISLKKGIELLSSSSSQDSIVISTQNPFDSYKFNNFLNILENKILLDYNVPKTFSIYKWEDINRGLFYSFSTTKNLILFIVFLITLVASVNISHALIMLVMERRAEIAILKANGASPTFITLCFLTAGFITSFLGLLIGMPIGILISIHVNEILKLLENILNYVFYCYYLFFNQADIWAPIHLLNPAYYLEYIPVNLNFYELYFIAIITLSLSFIVSIIPARRAGREKPLSIMRKI